MKKEGFNEIGRDESGGIIKILLNQFKNFLLLLLIFAAILSLVLGELSDFFGISAIIFLTVILGFVQEYRAERAMAAHKKNIRAIL
ncbi:MAG: hypothetical protein KatS3mg002_0778 [Candidatus Woesearchaeota archaeon]|nr:MAG: hypothetical protein KatS3mg002_0778 [Candidatus Woesearchaeota archaeon]